MENTNGTTSIIPFSEVEKMGNVIAKSQLFGVKTPDQAIALMLIAQAEGSHPAIAARDYHIIQGRPSLKSDAMLSRFQQSGGKVAWEKVTDEEVTGIFSHSSGGSLSITWDMKRAKLAELTGKDNWKKYPRQMLRARVISEGIRSVYPACISGFYAPEEVQDIEPLAKPEAEHAVIVDEPPVEGKKEKEITARVHQKPVNSSTTSIDGHSDQGKLTDWHHIMERKNESMVIPFGYAKGKRIGDLSEEKLRGLKNWCINNSKYPEMVTAISEFLAADDFPMFDRPLAQVQ
jgi:hypothetical protein